MSASKTKRRVRGKGTVQELPSGALRVSVYAGIDPITQRRHYLRETVPPGPGAAAEAERVMRRLAAQVDERRQPRTNATVNQLLDKHFEMVTVERTTLATYRGYADKHIRPLLGTTHVGALDAHLFDSFYAELRRCRDHCARRKRQIDHRTRGMHECDHRCLPHSCRPLSPASIRQIHFILGGALKRAVRWQWLATNPILQADPPPAPKPNPQPPTPAEAARLLNEAWTDPDWGTLVWLAIVTGLRRGELCALRWRDIDFETGVLLLNKAIGQRGSETWEKDTKTHQHRRIALDPETLVILDEHRQRWIARTDALDIELPSDAFVFSNAPDGSVYLLPNSVGERYGDMAARLGIQTSLHKLRHYSATELIAAGVDVRTVAGRLGHGGGGTTTLRVYAAWVSESDQRAAQTLFARMPARPTGPLLRRAPLPASPLPDRPLHPYEEIAANLLTDIEAGTYLIDAYVPAVKPLAAAHRVSVGTAHRALSLLAEWGLVELVPGKGFRVTGPPLEDPTALPDAPPTTAPPDARAEISPVARESMLLELTVCLGGREVARFSAAADPYSAEDLHGLLLDAIRRKGGDEAQVSDFEMEVRRAGQQDLITTFIAPRLRR